MSSKTDSSSWRPIWLRQPTLFAFVVLFFCLFVGLVIIYYYMTVDGGFSFLLTDESNPYPWTYGPTAILVIVVALWRRVNYCVLISQPWLELQRGGQSASTTVLLDYMWPLQINSFIDAVKNRHIAVATSIVIFSLLKASIVISTTLFLPGDTIFTQNFTTTRQTEFDAAGFWSMTGPKWEPSIEPGTSVEVSPDPVWRYMNLLRQYPNGEIPTDLAEAFTTSTIASPPDAPFGVAASSQVFVPHVSCEATNVSWPDIMPVSDVHLTIESPSCGSGNIDVGFCSAGQCALVPLIFTIKRVICTDDGMEELAEFPVHGTQRAMLDTYRNVIAVAQFDGEFDNVLEESSPVVVKRAAAVSCTMAYSLQEGTVHGPPSDIGHLVGINNASETGIKQSMLANWTGLQLSEAVFSSLATAGYIADQAPPIKEDAVSNFSYLEWEGAFLSVMSLHEPGNWVTFFDSQSLQTRAQKSLSGLSQQFMKYFCLRKSDKTTVANEQQEVRFTERRLKFRPRALWTMAAIFASMSVLVYCIIAAAKHGLVPTSPAFLATFAHVLAQSPDVQALLRPGGPMEIGQIHELLSGFEFTTGQNEAGQFCISVKSGATGRRSQTVDAPGQKDRRWMPWSARWYATALTLLTPLFSIAALEILWRCSEQTDGFPISSDTSVAAYAVRYSSTATALLIATLFSSLEFSMATMAPFSILAKGGVLERTVLFSIIEELPPLALYRTVRRRQSGPALSLMASTIGSGLTIAASGLWFLDSGVNISRHIAAPMLSSWTVNFNTPGGLLSQDREPGQLFSNIQHGFDADTPFILNNDTVLPKIGMPYGDGSLSPNMPDHDHLQIFNSTLHLTVPAIQPLLECSFIPAYYNYGYSHNLTYQPSPGCYAKEQPDGSQNMTWDFSGYPQDVSWTGQLLSYGENKNSEKLFFPAGDEGDCPSFAADFRYVRGGNRTAPSHIASFAVACTQKLQLVEANVTYRVPNVSVASRDSQSALTPVAFRTKLGSQASTLLDPESGSSSLRYNIGSAFSDWTIGFPSGNIYGVPWQAPDTFFENLVDGPDGLSPDQITSHEILIQGMNRLYQKYMVHVIDMNYRVDVTNTSVPKIVLPGYENDTTVYGTQTTIESRLRVGRISKIVLQAMLGAMTLLGTLAYWRTDMRNTGLPRNPYPIASSMALFAAGGMERGRKRDNVEGKEEDAAIYTLGWWEEEDEDEDEDEEAAAGEESDDQSEVSTEMVEEEARTMMKKKKTKEHQQRFGIYST